MRDGRRRLFFLLSALAVVAIGLASRRRDLNLPTFVAQYAGDTLCRLMVY